MGKRREARERAVQFLFQHDLNPPANLEAELAQFWNSQRAAAIEDEGLREALTRFGARAIDRSKRRFAAAMEGERRH